MTFTLQAVEIAALALASGWTLGWVLVSLLTCPVRPRLRLRPRRRAPRPDWDVIRSLEVHLGMPMSRAPEGWTRGDAPLHLPEGVGAYWSQVGREQDAANKLRLRLSEQDWSFLDQQRALRDDVTDVFRLPADQLIDTSGRNLVVSSSLEFRRKCPRCGSREFVPVGNRDYLCSVCRHMW